MAGRRGDLRSAANGHDAVAPLPASVARERQLGPHVVRSLPEAARLARSANPTRGLCKTSNQRINHSTSPLSLQIILAEGKGLVRFAQGCRPVACGNAHLRKASALLRRPPPGVLIPSVHYANAGPDLSVEAELDLKVTWRRGRDSNPRNLAVHLISNQTQSTTRSQYLLLFRPWRCFGALSGCEERRLPADEDHEAHAGSFASVEGPDGSSAGSGLGGLLPGARR